MDNLTFEQWVDMFKPVDKSTGEIHTGKYLADNCMLETFDGMRFIRNMANRGIISQHHVWTVVDGPKSGLILLQGFVYADALGYFLTARSHEGRDVCMINF